MDHDNPHFEKLGALLGIPELEGDVWEQDWELIYADSQRVEEFCELYEVRSLSDPDKFALMQLIVSSYDRYLGHEPEADRKTEPRIARLLEKDFELHKPTIEYWSSLRPHAKVGSVTPLMRRVLEKKTTGSE